MPKLEDSVASDIASIGPLASEKRTKETSAIASHDSRAASIAAARAKDVKDRTDAEQAQLNAGYLDTLKGLYEEMAEDHPRAPGLLAILNDLIADSKSLVASSDDAPPV